MCRIAGIVNSKINAQNLYQHVQGMCHAQAHGGPDGEGILALNENTVFGHRRLSLIDLSTGGHQPMQYNQLSITFNGEIYNYQILKDQLIQLGYSFNSQSDTEVLLIGFHVWGVELFNKLEGMFAFALYNGYDENIYLVRDQLGVKPLYYNCENDQLTFASEVRAFESLPTKFAENPNWKAYFLSFGFIPQPFTTLEDVYALDAGHYLLYNQNQGLAQIKKFAIEETDPKSFDIVKAIQQTRHNLNQAVKSHLIADAPIGVFLSGGIDSSLLTLLAHEQIGENLNSLSINFNEEAFSEAKYQKIIVDKIKSKHQSYVVKEADFNEHFDSILQAMDQPTNDGINSWFVNKCAKENGLKAVLSGIGADELLGGYPSFKRYKIMTFLKTLPNFLLRLAIHLPNDKLKRIYFLSYQNPIGEYLFLRGFFTPNTVASLLNCNQSAIDQLIEEFPIDQKVKHLHDADKISWLETQIFMKNQLLKDTDFMSMAHGIEVRVPFLDQNFIAGLNSLDASVRFPKQAKGLLITAFKNILPEAIYNRPKMGFSFPLQKWFLKNSKIQDQSWFENHPEAKLQMDKFNSGKLHWSKAFALYQVFNNK